MKTIILVFLASFAFAQDQPKQTPEQLQADNASLKAQVQQLQKQIQHLQKRTELDNMVHGSVMGSWAACEAEKPQPAKTQ